MWAYFNVNIETTFRIQFQFIFKVNFTINFIVHFHSRIFFGFKFCLSNNSL
jgi:hypothetical protein